MSLFHESLKRLLTGATLRGSVKPVKPNASHSVEFSCLVRRIEKGSALHEWTLHLLVPAHEDGQKLCCDVNVRWDGSVSIVSLKNVDLPNVGIVERAEVIFQNRLFAGVWVCQGVRGHVHGEIEHAADPQPQKCWVIERSGECMRDWWTGTTWSDDYRQAKWYPNEPHPNDETGDEAAHSICYPSGHLEAG